MANASHRSLVVFVFYEMDESILEFEVQELLVKVTLGSCLSQISAKGTVQT